MTRRTCRQKSKTKKFVAGDSVEYLVETATKRFWVPAIVEAVNIHSVRINYFAFGQERMTSTSTSRLRHFEV